jgi:hypothetical protein
MTWAGAPCPGRRLVACSLTGPRLRSGGRRPRNARQPNTPSGPRRTPWPGLPASFIPEGVAPAAAMLQAAKDARPRRQSVLDHALADRDGQIEYIPIGQVSE